MDLFSRLEPMCGSCQHYGTPINPGIAYCYGELTFRRADDQVAGCVYRERLIAQPDVPADTRVNALRDLLESPRHNIGDNDRAWLHREFTRETQKPPSN